MVAKKRFRSSVLSRKRLFISAILMILLGYGVSLLLVSVFSIVSPYRIETLDYDFMVKDNVGVNVDVDSLHFGGGPAGITLERSLSLTSDRDARVVISWEGPGQLSVSRNDFKIYSGIDESVVFYLIIPPSLELGTYSGTVTFSFFKD